MVRIGVDVESFVVGLSVWIVGSVREVYGDVEEDAARSNSTELSKHIWTLKDNNTPILQLTGVF